MQIRVSFDRVRQGGPDNAPPISSNRSLRKVTGGYNKKTPEYVCPTNRPNKTDLVADVTEAVALISNLLLRREILAANEVYKQ